MPGRSARGAYVTSQRSSLMRFQRGLAAAATASPEFDASGSVRADATAVMAMTFSPPARPSNLKAFVGDFNFDGKTDIGATNRLRWRVAEAI